MSSLLTEPGRTVRLGASDLRHVVLAARTGLRWSARRRLAAAMNVALHAAGLPHARARAGAEGITVALTVRTSEPEAAELVAGLTRWRSSLAATPIPPRLPPTSPAELVTALTFDDGADDPAEGELRDALSSLALDVVVAGPMDDLGLDALRDQVARALATGRPDRAVPPPEQPAPPAPTGRRWARVSVGPAWVRWYRHLPPPADDTEHLARSLANIAFGGIQRSPFQELVRRQHGLSYAPQSSLTRLDGRHVLALDVPTAPGREDACDEVVAAALAEFAASPLSGQTLREAATYLLGRTVVDRDSLQGSAEERAAVLAGTMPGLFSTEPTADELCALARPDRAAGLARTIYQPAGFDALVVSPARPADAGPDRKWVEL